MRTLGPSFDMNPDLGCVSTSALVRCYHVLRFMGKWLLPEDSLCNSRRSRIGCAQMNLHTTMDTALQRVL